MPTAIILELFSSKSVTLHPDAARANYRATLHWLEECMPGLGQALHDLPDTKPLTCSGVLGISKRKTLKPNVPFHLRITSLADELDQGFRNAFLARSPTVWRLSGADFHVKRVIGSQDDHPWAGCITYQELVARHLYDDRRRRTEFCFQLASPTAFRSSRLTVPLPTPELFFSSLLSRWNAFGTPRLEPDQRLQLREAVAANRFSLQTLPVPQKGQGTHIGSIGKITYRIPSKLIAARQVDRTFLATLNLLAEFAFYSGVGIKTTMGMGQVRLCD